MRRMASLNDQEVFETFVLPPAVRELNQAS